MTSVADHNVLIGGAAREALSPLGLFRKGRSRIWLDDHGWWLGIVEFQPSSWSKTTGLNVAAQFLWQETDHLRYDVTAPSAGLMPKRVAFDPEQPDEFATFVRGVAEQAAHRITALRTAFGDDANLLRRLAQEGDGVPKAIALGLLGDLSAAQAIAELAPACSDRSTFTTAINASIRHTRKALHLPEVPDPEWPDAGVP